MGLRYGWVSPTLIGDLSIDQSSDQSLDRLIPLESLPNRKGYNLSGEILNPKIVVGHNVSYDRARVKEQYWIERTGNI